jgi:hypothetical protein
MTETAEKLKLELAQLSLQDRAELESFLIRSLDEEPEDEESEHDVESAWDIELTRRMQKINEESASGQPASQVFAESRTMADQTQDIFISYSVHDRDFVEQLAQGLLSQGFSTIHAAPRDPSDLRWADQIEAQMERSRYILFVVSQASLSSPAINFEIGIALSKAAHSPDTAIIPVFTQEVNTRDLPFSLKNRLLVNAVNLNPREVGQELGKKLLQQALTNSAPFQPTSSPE